MSTYKTARLTADGLNKFRGLLQSGRGTSPLSKEAIDKARRSILKSKVCRDEIRGGAVVDEMQPMPTKRRIAEIATTIADESGVIVDPNVNETGFWAWLALVFFWKITESRDIHAKVRPDEHYIPNTSPRKFYRHLLGGPAWTLKAFDDHASMLLAGSPTSHGDRQEQLLGNKVTGRSPGIMEAAHLLFWDDTSSTGMRKGANPNNKDDPGLRYFVRRVRQLACTYDIHSMSGHEILKLLPELAGAFPPASLASV